MGLSNLYNDIKTLIHQNFYDKEDIDETLGDINDFIDSDHTNIYTSEIVDSISNNDLRAVTSNAVFDALTAKANTSHTQTSSSITDMTTETITITYDDNSTETLTLFVQNNS